jgi:hypothetical protein
VVNVPAVYPWRQGYQCLFDWRQLWVHSAKGKYKCPLLGIEPRLSSLASGDCSSPSSTQCNVPDLINKNVSGGTGSLYSINELVLYFKLSRLKECDGYTVVLIT